MKLRFSRRSLLESAGYSALSLPLFSVLAETGLLAAETTAKALFVYYPDGSILKDFFPSNTGTNFKLPYITAPLEPFRDRIILPKGLNYRTGGSHEGGSKYCFTGVADNSKRPRYSIDSYLGDKLGSHLPFKCLRLGIGSNFQAGHDKRISYLSTGAGAFVQDHPKKAFLEIFGQGLNNSESDQAYHGNKSVLDFSLSQMKSLQKKLGGIEKQKLESHIQGLRELEKRIDNAGSLNCSNQIDYRGISFPDRETTYPPTHHTNDYFALIGDIMVDIMVEALHCGVTNFGLLQWSHAVSPTQFNFTNGPGINRGHHDASHYGGDAEGEVAMEFKRCQRWIMEQQARLLRKLDDRKMGGRSLLDAMTILMTTEIADSNLHNFKNIPCVIAGGTNGKLKVGGCYDMKGASFNRLHVTILQAMDLSDETFGDPESGSGALSQLI